MIAMNQESERCCRPFDKTFHRYYAEGTEGKLCAEDINLYVHAKL